MIAELEFEKRGTGGVRRARFISRASIPLGAACLVANGIRETLRELFGERCEVTLGEPVAIGPEAWATLKGDAYCFLTCGRQTDVVMVVPASHAGLLVQRAFGESEALAAHALSALEMHALERIAARCATTFDPLYAERHGSSQRIAANDVPQCSAFFDLRVGAPVAIEIGIGIVRNLPDPGPAQPFPATLLSGVPIELRAEFAAGTIDARTLLHLAPGDVVHLSTQVGAPSSLKIADTYIATGTGGIAGGRYSFEIQAMNATGVRS